MVPPPLSGYLGGWGELCAGPEEGRGGRLLFTPAFFLTDNHSHRQTRDSYCERGFCVELAAVCGVRCDRRVVGQWERLSRCRDSTLERTRWGSEGGCCGEVPAGRDHEGSARTERVWTGKPSTQTVDRCANFNILYKIKRNKLFNNTGLSVINKLLQ